MRTVLQRRLPLATTLAAVLFAASVAVAPGYQLIPASWPLGWAGAIVVYLLLGYTAVSLLAGGLACVEALGLAERRPRRVAHEAPLPAPGEKPAALSPQTTTAPEASDRAWLTGRRFVSTAVVRLPADRRRGWLGLSQRPSRHIVAAGCLAALVLVEGLTHLGAHNGFWVAGWPSHSRDPSSADGHVLWIEGWPVQEDSTTFVRVVGVLSGRESPAAIDGYARTGRVAYPFLVSLLARLTAPLGSSYAAFVGVNLLLWWGAAVAVYDLARRARRSWWAGLLAGSLVATGIGFTFSAANAMSTAAGYGAAPLVLWLVERLRIFSRDGRWSDVALTGCLATAAGLLNSLAPFYLGFAFLYYVGRTELRRLAIWATILLGLGVVWAILLRWAGSTGGNQSTDVQFVRLLLPLAAAALLMVGVARLPRRWGERCVALAAIGAAAAPLLIAVVWPQRAATATTLALAALHAPDYLLGRSLTGGLPSLGEWPQIPEFLRDQSYDQNFIAAFPPAIALLALLGFARLPRRWAEWCVAVAASGTVVGVAMITVTSVPHPRLMYVAYPAIYLLAASGLLNVFDAAHGLFAKVVGPRWLPPVRARALAIVAVLLCIALAAQPANASLWGNRSFDSAFHALDWGPG